MPAPTHTLEPITSKLHAFEKAEKRKHIVAELAPEALLLGIKIREFTNYIYLYIIAEADEGTIPNCWTNETYSTDLAYVRKLVRGLWYEYHKIPRTAEEPLP